MGKNDFLTGITQGFTPVIDAGFSMQDYAAVDLSVNNPELTQKEFSSPEVFEDFLANYLRKRGKKIAYGGYNEQRGLYRRSALFSAAKDEAEVRNIHLGVDIWAAEGTTVLSALHGKIHSFRDNRNFGDYGPTIIVEHEAENKIFYTLYGHLSRNSLSNIQEGMEVEKGQKIGELGGPHENGNYAPHLHFQIIQNLQDQRGDYPGVASKKEIAFYLENCPDPSLLLKIL